MRDATRRASHRPGQQLPPGAVPCWGVFALEFSLDTDGGRACGTYLTVDPPYRVVFTRGIPDSDTLPPRGSTVEVVLTADGEDTMVVLTHRGQTDSHRTGWDHQLGRLPAAAGEHERSMS